MTRQPNDKAAVHVQQLNEIWSGVRLPRIYSHLGQACCLCADTSPQANTNDQIRRPTIERFNCQDLSNITVGFSRLSYYHEPYLQVSPSILQINFIAWFL